MDNIKDMNVTDMNMNIIKLSDLNIKLTKEDRLNQVLNLFELYGEADYIGEPVTQTQHMLQAAMLALKANYCDELIVAALLHDIGHLIPKQEKMGKLGVLKHESVGANYLRTLGFKEKVCDLVENHVNAKRYLITIRGADYKLGSASSQTLLYQGGLMTVDELTAFSDHPMFDDYIKLRKLDEQAKDPTVKVCDVKEFIPLCLRCMDE